VPLPFALLFVLLAVIGWNWVLLAFDRQVSPPKISASDSLPSIIALLGGVLVAAVAFVISMIGGFPAPFDAGSERISRAILEEVLKGLVLALLLFWPRARFAGWRQGIGYAGAIGAGFVLSDYVLHLENLLPSHQWETAFFWRILVFGGLPGLCAGITGIGLGLARTVANRALSVLAVVGGLAGAIAVNALLRGEIVAAATLNTENALPIFVGYLAIVIAYAVLYYQGGRRVAQTSAAAQA
jgi:hypothetical protein